MLIRIMLLTPALLGIWLLFSWIFVDRTYVEWQDCRLTEQDVEVVVRNLNSDSWKKWGLLAKVYQGKTLFASTPFVQESQPLASQATFKVRLPLIKPLPTSGEFRVEMFLQRGSSPLVSKKWENLKNDSPLRQFSRRGIGNPIPEPGHLRKQIQGLDVKKAMGIF